ncbi:MAG TPA: DsbA family protein [Pseudomonadales bacterium]|nr:DsbA family protein [Pseudomonadales bacterium]
MKITVTYYLDVISSWCYWAEPAWLELKRHYAGKPVDFSWKISLIDASGLPASREQEDWFYRRSGTIVRSPFMLSSDWFEPGLKEYLAPNYVAEAAKDLGVTDDRVRLAIAEAALRTGQKVGQWEVSAAVAAKAVGLDTNTLLAKARSPEIDKRVRASTAEFHALQVTQRPTFVLESNIGDRAVISGLVKIAPLTAAIDAMLDDARAYAAYAAHFGNPPDK